MAQQHLDRLTSIDASFLHQEGSAAHMHIGGVLVFEGPAPAFEEYLDHVRARLHLVPRYRQKLATPPLETGRPLWVDDQSFNLEYHVRHTALPPPGSQEQLFLLASRVASQQLDRSKPLWEQWLVEGLADGRFAIILKTHHSLVDGVSGVDLGTVLFDLERDPAPPAEDLEPWEPQREPSSAELVVAGVRGMVTTTAGLATKAIGAATRPASTLGALRDAAEGLGELVWAGLNPAPETPLNVPIGPHRRYAVVRSQLSEFKEVKNALGGTVNDVVLTVVSGALATWLRSRGIRTEGLEMRALVPVSVRSKDQRHTLGNQLVVMRGPLPVYIDDPVARLRFVRRAMDGLKESKQAVGAATLTAVNNLAPPTILAQASRLNFSTRLFNLLVTNIPGPQVPLYVLGRQLEDVYPVAFLPENHALAIAIMSYNGGIDFGLLGDYDALPDIDVVAEGIAASLAELLDVARQRDAQPQAVGVAPATARPDGQADGGADATGDGRDESALVAESESESEPESEAGASSPGAPAPFIPSDHARPKRGPAADMRAKRQRGSRPSRRRSES
ncbi:MAG TPA: wax ester/triacylglycerol synthase family O-acyltransferase [Solirubrobacteraceae bacterium]|nr:wax ester/triacylglycerol synthase family O-acyltransferase [Solirubrobacteraceae bacterium]